MADRSTSPGFWDGARSGALVAHFIGLPAFAVVLLGPLWTWRLVLAVWLLGWGYWLVSTAIGVGYHREVHEVRPEARYRPHLVVKWRKGWLWHLPGSRLMHTGARRRTAQPSAQRPDPARFPIQCEHCQGWGNAEEMASHEPCPALTPAGPVCVAFKDDGRTRRCAECGWWSSSHESELDDLDAFIAEQPASFHEALARVEAERR